MCPPDDSISDVGYGHESYPPSFFSQLYPLEDRNFWFVSRNRILKYLFAEFLGMQSNRVIELGCGTGYVLKMLSTFTKYTLTGVDIHTNALHIAKSRVPKACFVQADIKDLTFQDEFDAVGVFDVLEHIDNDELVLKNIYKILRIDGLIFITVPQHMCLWSNTDTIANHKRRYSRKQLLRKLKQNGFQPIFISSFMFTLLPIMYLSRFFNRYSKPKNQYKPILSELDLPQFINYLLSLFTTIDEFLIKIRLSLLCGGSLIVVAKKCTHLS